MSASVISVNSAVSHKEIAERIGQVVIRRITRKDDPFLFPPRFFLILNKLSDCSHILLFCTSSSSLSISSVDSPPHDTDPRIADGELSASFIATVIQVSDACVLPF